MTIQILAVCAGNICRSPTAEAVIRDLAGASGLSVEVDSAGTGSWNIGEPPTAQAVEVGANAGFEVSGRARKLNSADFKRFDAILVMDRSNLRDVMAAAPDAESKAKVRLFRTYDERTAEDEIPDPYGGSDEVYERTLDLIVGSAEGLVASLASVEKSIPLE